MKELDSKILVDEVARINKRIAALLIDCDIMVLASDKEAICTIACPSEYHKEKIIQSVPAGESISEEQAPLFHALVNAYGIESWMINYKVQENLSEVRFDIKTLHLNKMAKEINSVAISKGWWDNERRFGEIIALIHSELSEALEDFRSGMAYTQIERNDDGKLTGIPIELADAIIRILDFCGRFDIDIAGAVLRKMEYNKTRPHRHGGKKI